MSAYPLSMIIGRCYNHWYAKGGFGVHHEVRRRARVCQRGFPLAHLHIKGEFDFAVPDRGMDSL